MVPVWRADDNKPLGIWDKLVSERGCCLSVLDPRGFSQMPSNGPTGTSAAPWHDPKTLQEEGGTLLLGSCRRKREGAMCWVVTRVAAQFSQSISVTHLYLTMPACSSWWHPAVCVTCVSKDSRARTRWSCRGNRGSEGFSAWCTDCNTFTKAGYRSLWKNNHSNQRWIQRERGGQAWR